MNDKRIYNLVPMIVIFLSTCVFIIMLAKWVSCESEINTLKQELSKREAMDIIQNAAIPVKNDKNEAVKYQLQEIIETVVDTVDNDVPVDITVEYRRTSEAEEISCKVKKAIVVKSESSEANGE